MKGEDTNNEFFKNLPKFYQNVYQGSLNRHQKVFYLCLKEQEKL